MQYPSVDLHKKKADILVIHCADPRFQAAYRSVIDGLGKYYDLLVSPGASKAVVEDPALIDYINLLESLHHFEKIHILDHIECGAFGAVEDEKSSHRKMLNSAASKIQKAMPNLKVVPHLLGQDSEIKL